jgi:hypothetical protein
MKKENNTLFIKLLLCVYKLNVSSLLFVFQPESTYHGTINLGDTIAIGIQKKEAVTTVEKLFYDG